MEVNYVYDKTMVHKILGFYIQVLFLLKNGPLGGLHWLRWVGQRPTEVCWEAQLGGQQGIICCVV